MSDYVSRQYRPPQKKEFLKDFLPPPSLTLNSFKKSRTSKARQAFLGTLRGRQVEVHGEPLVFFLEPHPLPTTGSSPASIWRASRVAPEKISVE